MRYIRFVNMRKRLPLYSRVVRVKFALQGCTAFEHSLYIILKCLVHMVCLDLQSVWDSRDCGLSSHMQRPGIMGSCSHVVSCWLLVGT
jgi:hypothetical protein